MLNTVRNICVLNKNKKIFINQVEELQDYLARWDEAKIKEKIYNIIDTLMSQLGFLRGIDSKYYDEESVKQINKFLGIIVEKFKYEDYSLIVDIFFYEIRVLYENLIDNLYKIRMKIINNFNSQLKSLDIEGIENKIKNKKIIIFGMGVNARKLNSWLNDKGYNVDFWVEENEFIDEFGVIHKNYCEIPNNDNKYFIFVTYEYTKEIKDILLTKKYISNDDYYYFHIGLNEEGEKSV